MTSFFRIQDLMKRTGCSYNIYIYMYMYGETGAPTVGESKGRGAKWKDRRQKDLGARGERTLEYALVEAVSCVYHYFSSRCPVFVRRLYSEGTVCEK
jgi:hypothetical protein